MADDRIGEGDGTGVVLLIGSFSAGSDFGDGGAGLGFAAAFDRGFGAGFGAGFDDAFGAGFDGFAFDGDFGDGFGAAFDGFAAAFGFDGSAFFAVFPTGGFFDAFGCFVLRFVAMLHLKPRRKS